MLHDLRQALRSLARSPGLTAVVIASLALGSGANAAVYSAIDALLFRGPAGVVDPASLVDVYTSQITGATYGDSSYQDLQSIAAADTGLASVAAFEDRDALQVRAGANTPLVRVAAVTDGMWDVLGLHPQLGDWASPAAGGAAAVVISMDLWNALGSDPSIVGRAIAIDGRPYLVSAIAPHGFRGLHLDRTFGAWIRLDDTRDRGRGDRRLRVIARLAPGATLQRVQARLDALAADLARRYPETNVGTVRRPDERRRLTALAYSRIDPAARGRASLLAAILLTATALLLLSACVNAGSLLLSRGLARRTELTIKTALGADRARLVRAFLFESVLLAVAGAAAGVLAAAWTAGAIPALFAPEHARLIETHVDRTVMAGTMAAGALAGLVFGLAPALVATRRLSPDALRGDASRLSERPGAARLRMGLVAVQLALSTVFLVGSVLLSRAVGSAIQFDASDVAGSLAVGAVETYDDGFRDAATALLKRTPSIAIVGWVATPPESRPVRRTFLIERGLLREPTEIDINYASPEYFAAMRAPILDGRFFSRQDDAEGAGAVVVNEALAQRYFTDRAVGHTLTDGMGRTLSIVGVVRTRAYRALAGPVRPMVYYPMSWSTARAFCAVVRSHSNVPDRTAVADVRQELARAGRTRSLDVVSFQDHLTRALATDRLTVALIAACGLFALVLALVGVYGVMADVVRRRTREIGLRIALGAGPAHILRDVTGGSFVPAAIGILGGAAGAFVLVRIARTMVFEVPPADATTLAAICGGLSVVVLAAIAPSAYRALRVSPLSALRDL